MTASDIRDLIVARLAGAGGGNRRRWRIAVGEVRVYPLSTHPHCNWAVAASGTVREIEAVERAVDRISAEHPIVVPH